MAGLYNPEIEYGDTIDIPMTWLVNGTPRDLTGWTAEFKVYNDAGNVLLDLTNGHGITLGGSAGTIIVFAPSVETTGSPIPPGCYKYYLRLQGPATDGNETKTLLKGTFSVTAD